VPEAGIPGGDTADVADTSVENERRREARGRGGGSVKANVWRSTTARRARAPQRDRAGAAEGDQIGGEQGTVSDPRPHHASTPGRVPSAAPRPRKRPVDPGGGFGAPSAAEGQDKVRRHAPTARSRPRAPTLAAKRRHSTAVRARNRDSTRLVATRRPGRSLACPPFTRARGSPWSSATQRLRPKVPRALPLTLGAARGRGGDE